MISNADIPMTTVDFQVDTLKDEPRAASYFLPQKGTITANYSTESAKYNNYAQTTAVLIHEQKHKDNFDAGLHSYPVSPQQTYKLSMHDEISANIAMLIYLRQKYLETGDINVFYFDVTNKFDFYAKAIEDKKIVPDSKYFEDFNKEMAFIANGTRKMWEEKFAMTYVGACLYRVSMYSDFSGHYAPYHEQNYQQQLRSIYTIGGIDFWHFMKKDVEIPQKAEKRLDAIIKEKTPVMPKENLLSRIKNKVASWFAPKPKAPENKQIFHIRADLPQYKMWQDKDGYRVSEVLQRDIPDMKKQVIATPTKSYVVEDAKKAEQLRFFGRDGYNRRMPVKPASFILKTNCAKSR